MDITIAVNQINLISYNLHGCNQGVPSIRKLMSKLEPAVIMVQEHWLTPDNMRKLSTLSDNYIVFGSSAMATCVNAGPLFGRPYGGTAFLINKKLLPDAENIMSQDRFTVVKIYNWLLITVYLPCVGTPQRDFLYSDMLSELQTVINQYSMCDCLIGGDFNTDLDSNTDATIIETVDQIYDKVVVKLRESAELFIPKRKQNFYKFWWNQELDSLKESAVSSCRAWEDAGKPRSGAVFSRYKKDKLLYKKRIREERFAETECYSNDLHEALLRKSGQEFWKTWKSKFEHKKHHITQVDGISDSRLIAEKFADHFESICSPLNRERSNRIKCKYTELRQRYVGTPIMDNQLFDVELISKQVNNMANGKAAGLDELSSEHLKFSHPIVLCILTK